MNAPHADTSGLVGGPIIRYGGKGKVAPYLVPHFARAKVYAEPFFGAGSIFYKIPPGTYEREAVNDLDASIVTFFRVLRDRTDDLVRVCELTPHARDEFRVAMEHSDDPLEEARRVWVRSRQGFSGNAKCIGNWRRSVGDVPAWAPTQTTTKLADLRQYAARLRNVIIDSIDAADFVAKWGVASTFIYADAPYVHATRTTRNDYLHEMTDDDHRRVADALHTAVAAGARVAVSGYPSPLYDHDLFHGWRTVDVEVPSFAAHGAAARRVERLWMSYPATETLGYVPPDGPLFGGVR